MIKSEAIAHELLSEWGLDISKEKIQKLAKGLEKLSLQYDDHIDNHNKPKGSNTDKKHILFEIAHSASALEDALHKAKKYHTQIFGDHLHFPIGSQDGGLLSDLEYQIDIDSTPFIQSLQLLMRKALTQLNILIEAGPSSSWVSFVYGHPTMQMLVDCIFFLEQMRITEPLQKLEYFAMKIQILTDPRSVVIPGWDDYAPQVKRWWKEEGRDIWIPMLIVPSPEDGPGIREEWVRKCQVLSDRLTRMDRDDDRGLFGGVYPDGRMLRKRKSRKKTER